MQQNKVLGVRSVTMDCNPSECKWQEHIFLCSPVLKSVFKEKTIGSGKLFSLYAIPYRVKGDHEVIGTVEGFLHDVYDFSKIRTHREYTKLLCSD